MSLKNKTSKGKDTFDKIQKMLAVGGAKKIMFDYANDGSIESITFAIEMNGQLAGFRLPAMVDNVFHILYKNVKSYRNWDSRYEKQQIAWKEQAYNTAWANIRDWIDAQMALIQTQQVKLEQVFLPYMIMKDNQTLYDKVISNPSFLLGSGE